MCIAALFIIFQNLKQPICNQLEIFKTNLADPYNKYYAVIKINELSSHKKTKMNLNCVLLNAKSQYEKATYYMILEKVKL